MPASHTEGSAMLETALAAAALTALLAGLIRLSSTSSLVLRRAGEDWLRMWGSP